MAIEEEQSVEKFRCGKQPECISEPSCDLAPVLGDGGSSIPRWLGGTSCRIAGAAQAMTSRSNQCQVHRMDFTPLSFSVLGLQGKECRAALKCLGAKLADK